MRRLLAGFIISVGALTLAGCGNQTITMKISALGTSLSIVATGTADGINQAKAQANSLGGSSGGTSVQVLDGDQHDGNKICETDVTSKGQNYHIVVYSSSALIPATICDTIKTSGG